MRRFVQSLICVIMLGLKRLCVGFQPRFLSVPQVRRTLSSVEKKFLDVPFDSKDEVKALGARWDVEAKKWFIPAGVNPSVFQDFLKADQSVPGEGNIEDKSLKPKTFSSNAKHSTSSSGKTFLEVPFESKDNVKALGARWDVEAKKWFVPAGVDPSVFQDFLKADQSVRGSQNAKWDADKIAGSSGNAKHSTSSSGKTFLEVPFESKDNVKALGARWDVEAKKWFVPAGVDPSVFQDFLKVYISVPINERKDAKVLGAKWDKEKSKWFVVSSNAAALSRWTAVSSMEGSSEPLSSSKAADSFSAEFPASKDAVLVLSVDTNGLPVQDKGRYLTYEDLSAYDSCRIIQISYNLCRLSDMSPLESGSFIIQSDGFPIDNTEFHGITLDESQSTGIPFSEAADKVFQAMEKSDNVLSHNADFVHSVFRSELFRNGLLDHIHVFDHKKRWCSMELMKDILGLVDKRGSPKPPSLKELVQSTGGEDLPAQRNSQQNAEFLRSSLQVLLNTGKLIVPFKAY